MNRLSYTTLEDFLEDPLFREWVHHPSPDNTRFWKQWLEDNADKSELFQQAQLIARTLHVHEQEVTDELIEKEVATYLKNTQVYSKPDIQTKVLHIRPLYRWLAAASVAAVLVSTWLLWGGGIEQYQSWRRSTANVYIPPTGLLSQSNTGAVPMTVHLADGSTVVLQRNSQLYYPASFTGEMREVFLKGEAFFKVTRNPKRPFLVYAQETVTRVLGTSFTVRAYETDSIVQVSVHSGKVSVNLKHPDKQTSIFLTPNQQVVYSKEEKALEKTLIDAPQTIASNIPENYLVFDNYPISDVFSKLEKMYGIPIVYDADLLKNCTLTADLSDTQGLYNALTIICKSLSASYEETNGEIMIHSKGCQ